MPQIDAFSVRAADVIEKTRALVKKHRRVSEHKNRRVLNQLTPVFMEQINNSSQESEIKEITGLIMFLCSCGV